MTFARDKRFLVPFLRENFPPVFLNFHVEVKNWLQDEATASCDMKTCR